MLGAGTPTNLPAIVDRHYSPVALLDASTVTTYRLDSPVPIAVFRCYLQASKKISIDVRMSSIQAYKPHKQEETIAATTLVSKVHKQGALGTSSNSQASLHQWLHDNCRIC